MAEAHYRPPLELNLRQFIACLAFASAGCSGEKSPHDGNAANVVELVCQITAEGTSSSEFGTTREAASGDGPHVRLRGNLVEVQTNDHSNYQNDQGWKDICKDKAGCTAIATATKIEYNSGDRTNPEKVVIDRITGEYIKSIETTSLILEELGRCVKAEDRAI